MERGPAGGLPGHKNRPRRPAGSFAEPRRRTCAGRGQVGWRPRPARQVPAPDFPPRPVIKPVPCSRQVRGDSRHLRSRGDSARRHLPFFSGHPGWRSRALAQCARPPRAWAPGPGRPRRRAERGHRASGPPGGARRGRPIAQMQRLRPTGLRLAPPPAEDAESTPERGRFGAGVWKPRASDTPDSCSGQKNQITGLQLSSRSPRRAAPRGPRAGRRGRHWD